MKNITILTRISLFFLILIGTIPWSYSSIVSANHEYSDLSLAWSAVDFDTTAALAWGDYDNDGDLDLATGNAGDPPGRPNRLYRNDAGSLVSVWTSAEIDFTTSLAWGDYDRDGDLDLVTGNQGSNRLYRNDNSNLFLVWSSLEKDQTYSVAWGDSDGDGDLDLAVGNHGVNRLYRNDQGVLVLAWSSTENDQTYSVTWADVDKDADLDLFTGNDGSNRLYRNNNGTFSLHWSSAETDDTRSTVWGDLDNDADLDLIVGNWGSPSRLYRNNAGVLTLQWSSSRTDYTAAVALGDADGDGDLDLAVGNALPLFNGAANRLYRNDAGILTPIWASQELDYTTSVSWVDVDGDGDLDLSVGNYGLNRLYRNASSTFSLVWTAPTVQNTEGIAWGDMDSDGDLDLAVGNDNEPNRIYRNNAGLLELLWVAPTTHNTRHLAWGDIDDDGDLDLIVGNAGSTSQLYYNLSGNFQIAPWTSLNDDTQSLAWGDVDGDGDLDLAVGNANYPQGQANRLYRNNAGTLQLAWSSPERDRTLSVVWGDVDNDGDLDLAVGNSYGDPNRLYRNENGNLVLIWSSSERDYTTSLAWGDVDRDGDLDLVVGNAGPNRLYRNDDGALTLAWTSLESDDTESIAWGDSDGDGDLDLAVGNFFQPNRIYRNDRGELQVTWVADQIVNTTSLAWGDIDRDGDLDLAVGVIGNPGGQNQIYRNSRVSQQNLINNPPIITVDRPAIDSADFYSAARIINSQTIVLDYTLRDSEGDSVREILAEYSLDGGGIWHPAIAASGTITRNLATSVTGIPHTFTWDVFASGVFGQSDNVVIRITALPGSSGANSTPFFQRSYASATTLPFRVRGSQVRVLNEQGQPVPDAVVLRRPLGNTAPASAFTLGAENFATTDQHGYLRGRGNLGAGDILTALAPVALEVTRPYTYSATLYHTNITPTTGQGDATVNGFGVQSVTVRATRPLLLFHLDVSLEWDARNDARYLTQLEVDLRRASELLFDATNGQAALGDITIYHDKENWDVAHVRVHASSRYRPNAVIGGVSGAVLTRTLTVNTTPRDLVYGPGQLQMGATWNRFGNVGDNLAEDWARTFVHELGHYLFFLDDNYIGVDANGRFVAVESCPGLMADPYASVALRPVSDWLPACQQTFSQQVSGQADWQTIRAPALYPFVQAPNGSQSGPFILPLDVTGIAFAAPLTPTERLPAPYFYTRDQNGERVVPSPRATAYLFQDSWRDVETVERDRVTPLGGATVDFVTARGVRVGDRVCLFDPGASPAPLSGCSTITPGDETITLRADATWQPELTFTPVTSVTLAVAVTLPTDYRGPGLVARIHPDADTIDPIAVPLTRDGDRPTYRGDVTFDAPVFAATVHVWNAVPEADPARREGLSAFSIGGNPGMTRLGGGMTRLGGGFTRLGGGMTRLGGGMTRLGGGMTRLGGGMTRLGGAKRLAGGIGGAPVASATGDVQLYAEELTFALGEYVVVQASDTVPNPPVWATPIGQSYLLIASANVPDLSGLEISFSYRGREVPVGEEDGIRMYYQAPGATTWTALETSLNTYYNLASAQVRGPGRYALMSSIEVPLQGPGWNNVAYPVPGKRPVAEALAGIAGKYTVVYGYEQNDTNDHWKVYTPDAPAWVNDLSELQYGRGYWIRATEAVTIPLRGSATLAQSAPLPPMTIYGSVSANSRLTPTVGMEVQAQINGNECGRGTLRQVNGALVYSLDVASFAEESGCGMSGSTVKLQISSQTVGRITWADGVTQPLDLMAEPTRLFLPILSR